MLKAETLLSFHVEHRKKEREMNPRRFNVKKTIAERCIQRPEPIRRGSDSIYEKVDLTASLGKECFLYINELM